jgi:phosphohistidine phosphatase SixA/ketosteroid isomerase-like protein
MRSSVLLFSVLIAALCLFGSTRLPESGADEIGNVLDDFHRAAAEADEARYFGHFTPDGVFLGTDPTERWTVDAFRRWARPYFARESAWTFVPRDRHVTVAPDGTCAWFDEVAESRHYGACRGTGVLRKIDGRWKIAQYNLTLPIPNERMAEVVRLLARDPADAASAGSLVLVVRHAEKAPDSGDGDPPLSARGSERARALAKLLRSARLGAVYATQYRRTRETVAPSARAAGLEIHARPAGEPERLVRTLLANRRGQTVLVAAHSNTVPRILAALGVKKRIMLADADYGDLFIVSPRAGQPAPWIRMRFGD